MDVGAAWAKWLKYVVLLNTFNLAKDYEKTLKLRLRVLGPARKKKKVYQLSRGGRRCTDVP